MKNPFSSLLDYSAEQVYVRDTEVHNALYAMTATPPGTREFYGLPEMGKSTLLRYLADPAGAVAQHRDWLLEPFRTHEDRLLPVLVRFASLPETVHPLVFLYESFQTACSSCGLHQNGWSSSSRNQPLSPMGAADLLHTEARALASKGIRPVLLLDDFDVAFERLSKEETTKLRPLRDFACLILITERSLVEVNPLAAGSPFTQAIAPNYVGSLSHDESLMFLERTVAQSQLAFPKQDIEFLIECAGGHPYLLILAGKTLWETRERLGQLQHLHEPLPEKQRDALKMRLSEDYLRTFLHYWASLERNECEVLTMIVTERLDQLQPVHFSIMHRLAMKGLLKDDLGDSFFLFSPLFAQFVEERVTEPVRHYSELTELEANLYNYLVGHERQVCSFSDLWANVWHEDAPNDQQLKHIVRVTVSRLRKKLQQKASGEDIVSVREVGYRYMHAT